jgi:hypothetical protein
MLRISQGLDNRPTDGGNVVSLTHRSCCTPQKHFFVVSGRHFWINPKGLVRLEGIGKLKKNHSPHRDSNQRPSGLYHSASTNYATAYAAWSQVPGNIIRWFHDGLHNQISQVKRNQYASYEGPMFVDLASYSTRKAFPTGGVRQARHNS